MFGKEKKKEENTKKESAVVTKESICATCAVFSFIAVLILCTRTLIFGEFGRTMHVFFTGTLGYLAYPAVFGALYLSIAGLFDKRFVKNRKLGFTIALLLCGIALIVHAGVTYSWEREGYLKKCLLSGDTFPKTAPCGLLGGLIVLGFRSIFSEIGGIVALSILTLFFAYLCYLAAKKAPQKTKTEGEDKSEVVQDTPAEVAPEQSVNAGQPQSYMPPIMAQRPGVSLSDGQASSAWSDAVVGGAQAEQSDLSPDDIVRNPRDFLFGESPAENYRKNLLFDPNARVNQRPNIPPSQATVQSVYTPSYTQEFENSVNQAAPQTPNKVVSDRNSSPYTYGNTQGGYTPSVASAEPIAPVSAEPAFVYEEQTPTYETPVREEREEGNTVFGRENGYGFVREPVEEPPVVEERREEEYKRHDYMDLFSSANPNVFGNTEESARMGRTFADRALERSRERLDETETERTDGLRIFDEEDDPYTLRSDFETPVERGGQVAEGRSGRESLFENLDGGKDTFTGRGEELTARRDGEEFTRGRGEEFLTETPREAEPPKTVKPRIIRPYVRPRLDDFDCRDIEPMANDEEVRQTKENIIAMLEEYNVTGASIASVTFGPTVTRYNVTIPRSISPKKVVALDQSIAMNLHSQGVNVYPNYEDGVVSIEVPNKNRQFVQLGCMLSGDTFVNAKSSSLMFAMGKDVANRKVYGDITKMIHLLVAGSSGSGKSVFLGSLIISLIYKYSPEELRLILIDPKKTEFVLYNNLPHLMINEIITDAGKAVQSLNWAIGEMNRRYMLFEKMSLSGKYVVNLDQYNEQLEKSERLPKIVIIIDELADLMLAAKKEMEDRIQNLTQKARAAGIHLIVATQRPSTDVITGVIKSNLSTRVAFYVASDVDSRVILDQTGAQKLIGKGDFLYTMPGINLPVRVQSAFISAEESQRIVNFIKNNNEAYYDEEATAYINSRGGDGGDSSERGDGTVDPMYIDALRYVIQSGSASISMIQRKCSAGYNRAGKIVEWMEDMGYISPFEGAKARKVLITKEEFESKYGSL